MIIRFLLNTVAVLIVAYLLPGVTVNGFFSALVLALLLAFLNATVKPMLIILTIPATILSLGLFIFVINALVILLADWILPGFEVDGFWWAVGFSILLWIVNSLLKDISGQNREDERP
jgi:putative membrane protein